MTSLVALIASGIFLAVADAAEDANEPRAFSRAQRSTDVLPSTVHFSRLGRVTISRHIATFRRGALRRGSLYVFKTSTGMTCIAMVTKYAGVGCNPTPLFERRRLVFGASAGLTSGVAANEVTRVVVVRPGGKRQRVRLSPDNGFVFDCRPYDVHNGCLCVVAGLDAYAADGRQVFRQRHLPKLCSRRK